MEFTVTTDADSYQVFEGTTGIDVKKVGEHGLKADILLTHAPDQSRIHRPQPKDWRLGRYAGPDLRWIRKSYRQGAESARGRLSRHQRESYKPVFARMLPDTYTGWPKLRADRSIPKK